jgi:outer membrane autotransporter protein
MAVAAIRAGQQAELGQLFTRTAAFRQAPPPAPTGAAGPDTDHDPEWTGWIEGYGGDIRKDTDGTFSGYDADIVGAVGGMEKRFGNLLAGLALGQSRTDVETTEPGSSDTDTYSATLYGTLARETWFADAALGYGHHKIDSRRGTFNPAHADYAAESATLYLGAGLPCCMKLDLAATPGSGRTRHLQTHCTFTPDCGIQIGYYRQEGFTETGILANRYDAYDHWSYQTILGSTARMDIPVGRLLSLRPELHLHWRHEFNNEAGQITYTTQGLDGGASASIQSPEEDTLSIGTGIETRWADRLAIGLRADWQFAEGWRSFTYGASLKLSF